MSYGDSDNSVSRVATKTCHETRQRRRYYVDRPILLSTVYSFPLVTYSTLAPSAPFPSPPSDCRPYDLVYSTLYTLYTLYTVYMI